MLIPEGDKCTYEPAVTREQGPELAYPYQHWLNVESQMVVGECLWKLLEIVAVIDSKRHVCHLKLERRPYHFERLSSVLGIQNSLCSLPNYPSCSLFKGWRNWGWRKK